MTATDTTIADQGAALGRDPTGQIPAAVSAAFAAERTALTAAGVPEGVASVGSGMPDGALLDTDGRPATLAQVRDGRPAVVVFYRGAWCPYCNITLRTYQKALAHELDARGVALIAVSPQRPDGSLTMRETHALRYAVLSDPGNQSAGRLGILSAQSAAGRAARVRVGLDVAAVNADGTDTIPMPTMAIVDAAGTLRWLDVHPDYTTRTEPGAILAALDATVDQEEAARARTALAVDGEGHAEEPRSMITFDNPAGVAPPSSNYSHVASADLGTARLLFVARQIAVGPEGQPVGAGDAGKQAERIFENIRAILAAHGATLRHVAKLTTFFADMADRAEVGPVRDRYFPAPAPPNTVVEVSRLAHADWLLEVEAVAVVKA